MSAADNSTDCQCVGEAEANLLSQENDTNVTRKADETHMPSSR